MEDNYPSYLNPHNIDPGRIEAAARIDAPPRPGAIGTGTGEMDPNGEEGAEL